MSEKEKSIKELCKPLSAKVMPASAMYSIGGRKMDEDHALQSQRRIGFDVRKTKKLKKGKVE